MKRPDLLALVAVLALAGTGATHAADWSTRLIDGLVDMGMDAIQREIAPTRAEKPTRRSEPPTQVDPASVRLPAVDWDRVSTELDSIQVADEIRRGYDREEWPHWSLAKGECVDTRNAVLERDSLVPVRWSRDGCKVTRGQWLDPYTMQVFANPRDLDVDHFVPLAEAYRSGGAEWPTRKKEAYANDMSDPRALVPVEAAANRAKGDKGPEEWLPPAGAYLCNYVANWISIKARWSMTMDERERVTVGNIAASCRSGQS